LSARATHHVWTRSRAKGVLGSYCWPSPITPLYEQHCGNVYFPTRSDRRNVAELVQRFSVNELLAMSAELLTTDDRWISGTDRGLSILYQKATQLSGQAMRRRQPTPPVPDPWTAVMQRLPLATIRVTVASHGIRRRSSESRIMSANFPTLPFPPPPKRPNGEVSVKPAPMADAERVVIRMLARRAARKWLASVESAAATEAQRP
jgi:hypothetical protein